jgi:hypothetical protein
MGKEAAHPFNLGILIWESRGIGFDVILYEYPPGSEESLILASKDFGGPSYQASWVFERFLWL